MADERSGPGTIQLGALELQPALDGYLALDGGAMFGVVPKPLWERVAPADARNRIRMAMRAWLVRDGKQNILIDAGAGDKLDPKAAAIYALDRAQNLTHALAARGLDAGHIDLVIASHLHFDHAGGFTEAGPDGTARPRFPNARPRFLFD